jgi:formate transporter
MERTQKKSSYTGQPGQRYKGPRPPSSNLINEVYHVGSRRLNRTSNLELFLLAILAGAFMCAATLFSLLLVSGITTIGIQNLMGGLGLTVGLLLIILTKSILFSEANVYVPANFYQLSIVKGCLRLFRFWIITWIGNFIGAFLLAFLIYLCQEYSDQFKQLLTAMNSAKLYHPNGTLRGTGELIISGMLANWLIALVAFFAFASRNLVNQFVILLLVLSLIYGANFQYFTINLSYLSLATFLGKPVGLLNAIFFNLIPVSLGNILGATILVSGPLLFLSKKR